MRFSKLIVAVSSLALVLAVGAQTATAQEDGADQEADGNAPYGMAGCGLGSMAIGSGGGILQVFAATTNNLTLTQVFGITSGTSNCVERGVVREDAEQEAFFETNYDKLRAEMASGKGEHLEAMSSLLGCSDEVQPQVAATSQENYEAVFPNEETTPNQALYTYKMELSQHEELARSCNRL